MVGFDLLSSFFFFFFPLLFLLSSVFFFFFSFLLLLLLLLPSSSASSFFFFSFPLSFLSFFLTSTLQMTVCVCVAARLTAAFVCFCRDLLQPAA